MQTQLTFHLTVDLAGDDSPAVAAQLRTERLDLAILNLVRAQLTNRADGRDWRIVQVTVTTADGEVAA